MAEAPALPYGIETAGRPADAATDPASFRRSLAILLALHAVCLLPFLGQVSLWNIDEGRIAEVAREMAASGDWIVPRIGGEPFGSYPPLPYWLMAASGSVFGFNEFAMRLPGALAGLALVALAGLMARRLAGDRAGLASAVVLMTLPGFTSQEFVCRADVMLALFSTLAFDRFLVVASGDRRARHLAVMYAALALAILTKGPLGLALPGLGVLVWLAIYRRWRVLLEVKPWIVIPAMLAVVAPWYVAAYQKAGPEFIRTNLLLENVNAFTSGFEHPRPWWSHAAWASYRLIPWIIFLPFTGRERRTPGFGLTIGWAAAIFVLLTVSSSKRSNYLTYLCPAFAMSVGILLEALWRQAPSRVRRPLIGLGAVVAIAGLAGFVAPIHWKGNFALMGGALKPIIALLIAGGTSIVVLTRWKGAFAGTAALAAMLVLGVVFELAVIEPRLDVEGRDGTAFCARVAAAMPAGETLATPGDRDLDGSYQFYLRRVVPRRRAGPGYYLGVASERDRFDPSTVRVLDQLADDRGRVRYFFKVER
jgi:4-amino-4-deoxy-L-arabinose transferase-like glycosyltransferase